MDTLKEDFKKVIYSNENELWLVRTARACFPRSWGGWLVITLSLLMVVGKSGVWTMPNLEAQFIVSQNLTHNPFLNPYAQCIFTNYLQPALFGVLGGKSLLAYAIYVSITTIIFFLVFLFWFVKFHGKAVALEQKKLLAVAVFPVFMVPFYWLGMDGMTLLLMLIVMLTFFSSWTILPAIFLAWQHFEQGIVAFTLLSGTLAVAAIVSHDKNALQHLKIVIRVIIGLLIGKALMLLWFHVAHIELAGGRYIWLQTQANEYIDQWKAGWPYILFSLLGVGWVLVLKSIKKSWPLVAGAVFVFIFLLVMGDQTRVGSIILFPTLFYWVLMDKELWNALTQKRLTILVVLHLVSPVVYVWGGYPFGSLWEYDLAEVRKVATLGLINSSQFDWLRPFRHAKEPALIVPRGAIAFNDERLLLEGWSGFEKDFVWSLGNEVKIFFTVAEQPPLLRPRINLDSFRTQRVEIYLNNSKAFSGSISGNASIQLDRAVMSGKNELRFVLPDAVSPGKSDSRVIAVALRFIEFD